MPNILVTGAAGFIGSHFCKLALHNGDSVLAMDALTYAGHMENLRECWTGWGSGRFKFMRRDIKDGIPHEWNEEADILVNFAAESHVDRSLVSGGDFILTNVFGTYALLRDWRYRPGRRFVHISTDEVYGSHDRLSPVAETAVLFPSSPYSASKASADLLVLADRKVHDVESNVVIVRSSNNYGPNQHPEKLIPLAICRLHSDEQVPVYGDGCQLRDWLYVGDNCEGIYLAMTKGAPGEIYNLCTMDVRRNIDLLHALCAEMQKDAKQCLRFVEDRKGHDYCYAIQNQKAALHLGWQPRMEFAHGLRSTIHWYDRNRPWCRRVLNPSMQASYAARYEWDREYTSQQ
jgi:dTDP-glucose 4,6-dehydratase